MPAVMARVSAGKSGLARTVFGRRSSSAGAESEAMAESKKAREADLIKAFPAQEDIVADSVLELLMMNGWPFYATLKVICRYITANLLIACLLGRTWSQRRVTYTKEVITLTIPGHEGDTDSTKVFDAIPMFQIEGIREMEPVPINTKSSQAKQSNASKDGDEVGESQCTENSRNDASTTASCEEDRPLGYSVMIKYANSIEIRTSEEGHNSGRSYYLKASLPSLQSPSSAIRTAPVYPSPSRGLYIVASL
jgi:hypothetical protein